MVSESSLGIFNQLQKLRERPLNDESFFQKLKDELLGDEIVVFTPSGDVKQLPAGSTAIDFAYMIHSDIGEKIVGAKADGKIIPITQELKNTQIIEVLTNPQAHPTENQLKHARTSKARQKIHAWLTANDPTFVDKSVIAKVDSENAEHASQAHPLPGDKKRTHKKGSGEKLIQPNITRVKVAGMSNFMVTFAQCCRPTYPDPIVGYVSFSKGVMIHRADCLNYLRTENIDRRTIPVEWDDSDLQK